MLVSKCWFHCCCCDVQLLLELYEPLLISRARRVQGRNPNADFRELLSAARQGLLRAAARFDAGRVADGSSRGARLAALAERYIQNALRDVLTEVGWCWLRMCTTG